MNVLAALLHSRLLRDPDAERRRDLVGQAEASMTLYSSRRRNVQAAQKNAPVPLDTEPAHTQRSRNSNEHR